MDQFLENKSLNLTVNETRSKILNVKNKLNNLVNRTKILEKLFDQKVIKKINHFNISFFHNINNQTNISIEKPIFTETLKSEIDSITSERPSRNLTFSEQKQYLIKKVINNY